MTDELNRQLTVDDAPHRPSSLELGEMFGADDSEGIVDPGTSMPAVSQTSRGDEASGFLKRFWQPDAQGTPPHIHYIAVQTGSGFKHYPVKTIAQAIATAEQYSDAGSNVYFACAAYKTEADGRKGANASGAYGFWLDIDCGIGKAAAHQGYASQADGLNALRQFCKGVGLPKPTVVRSGNGLHIYWHFEKFIPADDWRALAKKLKQLTAQHGLLADPTRTADIASVLRVPGTLNWKDPQDPKPVVIANSSKTHDFKAFAAVLNGQAAPQVTIPSTPQPSAGSYPPSSALRIIAQCPTLAYVASVQGAVSEPLWRNLLGVVKHTVEGDALGHAWSKGDARYDQQETQDKIDHWTAGPTRCDTFRALPDAKCQGCQQRCTSPIQLGHVEQIEQVQSVDSAADDLVHIKPVETLDAAFDELNRNHFVAKVGGGVFVFDEREQPLLSSGMKFEGFRQFFGNQFVEGKSLPSTWLKSPRRRQYESLVLTLLARLRLAATTLGAGSRLNPQRETANQSSGIFIRSGAAAIRGNTNTS